MEDPFNDCEYIYLEERWEPEANMLRIVVVEMKPKGEPIDLEIAPGKTINRVRAVEPDATCSRFELVWPSYVAYSVRNESFTSWDEGERFEGKLFRRYSRSEFLDYIARTTFATEEYPGRITHWGLICTDHVIDVAACEAPKIRHIDRRT